MLGMSAYLIYSAVYGIEPLVQCLVCVLLVIIGL